MFHSSFCVFFAFSGGFFEILSMSGLISCVFMCKCVSQCVWWREKGWKEGDRGCKDEEYLVGRSPWLDAAFWAPFCIFYIWSNVPATRSQLALPNICHTSFYLNRFLTYVPKRWLLLISAEKSFSYSNSAVTRGVKPASRWIDVDKKDTMKYTQIDFRVMILLLRRLNCLLCFTFYRRC